MGKKSTKQWLVELDPPRRITLKPRAEGEARSAVRSYVVQAESRAKAQSQVEAHEQALEEQTGEDAWTVAKVSTA